LAAESRFELVRRGYDPQAVDREIKLIGAEIVRLQETSSELAEQLKVLNQKLSEAEQEIGLRAQPSYSALGTKAANLLSTAEEIAIKLTQDAKEQADELIARTESQVSERVTDLEQRYEEQLASAERRSSRRISAANLEAEHILKQAQAKAEQLILEAIAEAGRVRGQVATEIASMRSTARRELEQRKTELESQFAAGKFLLATEIPVDQRAKELALAELEAQISQRRKDAESEYLEKHQEAVRQTQQFLESAHNDIAELKTVAVKLRLEVQTLEMETSKTQARMLQDARDRAEALVHSAELEAVAISSAAQEEATRLVRNAKAELAGLENAVLSSKTYLKNLGKVVSGLRDLED
jgi:cell division septum initiation protein DivIVA